MKIAVWTKKLPDVVSTPTKLKMTIEGPTIQFSEQCFLIAYIQTQDLGNKGDRVASRSSSNEPLIKRASSNELSWIMLNLSLKNLDLS